MLGYVSVVLLGLDVTVIADVNHDAAVQVTSQKCTCFFLLEHFWRCVRQIALSG